MSHNTSELHDKRGPKWLREARTERDNPQEKNGKYKLRNKKEKLEGREQSADRKSNQGIVNEEKY